MVADFLQISSCVCTSPVHIPIIMNLVKSRTALLVPSKQHPSNSLSIHRLSFSSRTFPIVRDAHGPLASHDLHAPEAQPSGAKQSATDAIKGATPFLPSLNFLPPPSPQRFLSLSSPSYTPDVYMSQALQPVSTQGLACLYATMQSPPCTPYFP